jgi:hypothetical protein
MDPAAEPSSTDSVPRVRHIILRGVIAACVVIAVLVYIVGIVIGKVPAQHKLGGADVGILVVGILVGAALLRPQLLDRLTHFKLGSLEFELQQIQQDQKTQRDDLDNVRFILTLVLQHAEKEHLKNLMSGATQDYVGNHALRTELRRLRTLGLIANRKDQAIAGIKDGQRLDLKSVVQLTPRGKEYLEKIRDYEP